jgi:formate hydrogenlyase subunit 6/NADH:ubiquinone oxidoreductase subunit I
VHWIAWPLLVLCVLDLLARKTQNLPLTMSIHATVYAVFTPTYMKYIVKLPRWFIAKYLAPVYHGKVLSYEHAQAIVAQEIDVPRCDVGEHIMPYPVAREFLLKAGSEIGLLDCPCRRSKAPNNCEPTMVCMIFGSSVKVMSQLRNKDQYRVIKSEEALTILESEHKKGRVHTAWFKDLCDNKFFVLCNCCKCCCCGIELMMKKGQQCMFSSGYVAQVNVDQCIGCGLCAKTCCFEAITIEDRPPEESQAPASSSSSPAPPAKPKSRKLAVINRDRCMGCGACEVKCPKKCITLVRDTTKGDPLDIKALTSLDW